jgi:hypothetical protein
VAEITRILVGQKVSYAEAVKRVLDTPRLSHLTRSLQLSRPEERETERMSFSKVGFLPVIAVVINCTDGADTTEI